LSPRCCSPHLGRIDAAGRLRLTARSTPLPRKSAVELGAVLRRREQSTPGVAEVEADTTLDLGLHWHPVRYLWLQDDITPGDVRA
jgi:hypothetical protein